MDLESPEFDKFPSTEALNYWVFLLTLGFVDCHSLRTSNLQLCSLVGGKPTSPIRTGELPGGTLRQCLSCLGYYYPCMSGLYAQDSVELVCCCAPHSWWILLYEASRAWLYMLQKLQPYRQSKGQSSWWWSWGSGSSIIFVAGTWITRHWQGDSHTLGRRSMLWIGVPPLTTSDASYHCPYNTGPLWSVIHLGPYMRQSRRTSGSGGGGSFPPP